MPEDRTVYVYPSTPTNSTNVYHLDPSCGPAALGNSSPVSEAIAKTFGRTPCGTCQARAENAAHLAAALDVLPTGILDDLARCLEDVPGVEFRIMWVRPGSKTPRQLWTSKENS